MCEKSHLWAFLGPMGEKSHLLELIALGFGKKLDEWRYQYDEKALLDDVFILYKIKCAENACKENETKK